MVIRIISVHRRRAILLQGECAVELWFVRTSRVRIKRAVVTANGKFSLSILKVKRFPLFLVNVLAPDMSKRKPLLYLVTVLRRRSQNHHEKQ